MFHPRNENLLPLAKRMRKEMTPEEKTLWFQYLRGYPIRFRRQEILGDYIADFYCAKAKLVVELNGSQHYEDGQREHDRIRTVRLNAYGLTVIRIPNNEVRRNLRGVCAYIDTEIQRLTGELTPQSRRGAP